MNWKCPHCGAHVHADANQIKPGWSFAKCHQCLGYSLVRKVEMSVIKVDRPPLNEQNVLVTHAPEKSNSPAPPTFKKPETLAARQKNISSSIYIKAGMIAIAFITAVMGVQLFKKEKPVTAKTEIIERATAATDLVSEIRESQPAIERAQVIYTNVKLRSGPGVEFDQVGQANPNKAYRVKNRINQWVQLELDAENSANPNEVSSAWVRDDLIKKVALAE